MDGPSAAEADAAEASANAGETSADSGAMAGSAPDATVATEPDIGENNGRPDPDAAAPAAPDAAVEPPPVRSSIARVYLLAGQSNMVGLGRNAELPPDLARPRSAVRVHAEGMVDGALAGHWGTLVPGYGPTLDRFGPELTFGLALEARNPERRIHLIKHATGGAGLWNDWHPQSGTLYAEFRDHVGRALDDLRSEGLEPEIVGLLWMQGEADAQDADHASVYGETLSALITQVRADFSVSNLPVVVGLISTAPEWTHNAVVRAQQAAVAESLPQVDLVETADLARDFAHGDQYHYNTEGQRQLGARFADSWAALNPRHFDQAADFSTVNGERNWYALSFDGSQAIALRPAPAAEDALIGDGSAVRIGPGYANPDNDWAADIQWLSPGTGTLHIEGLVSDGEPDCGDGAMVEILSAGRRVWGPTPLGPAAAAPVPFVLDLPVSSQYAIVFRTESLGNDACDRTIWQLGADFDWAP